MDKPTVYTVGNCNFEILHHELGSTRVTVDAHGRRCVVLHHPGYSEIVAHLLTRDGADGLCEEIRAKHGGKQMLVEHVSYKKEICHKQPPKPAQSGGKAVCDVV